jgi:hypothetical protein
MKTAIRLIVAALVALVVIGVGGAYLIPAETVVQRQVVINALPEKVFAIVGDLRRFKEWSPWAELDPNLSYAFEGPETGVGQKMSWASDKPEVGRGSQTVTEFEAPNKVAMALDFGSMGTAQASLQLAPVDGGTGVTWGFKTEAKGVLDRWMSLMFDRWVGADYEKGLAKLKTLAESAN